MRDNSIFGNEMSEEINTSPLDELSKVLAQTGDPKLIRSFLGSLLTRSELAAISSRWALVRLLSIGVSQRAVARELGLSLCKITRGSKELKKANSPFAKMIGIYQKSHTSSNF